MILKNKIWREFIENLQKADNFPDSVIKELEQLLENSQTISEQEISKAINKVFEDGS
ncbi:hypothetical protein [Methanolobus sp.]|uniref:hypothetical protein n=1 Tax=Methanolobus sp. TaxID=1874737 RepID=UPI0025F0C2D2|nr:hypothetical protein [Methanolobus sp.]